MLSGQVDEVAAGAERETGVVRADHLAAAGDDDGLAGEGGRDRRAPLRVVGRFCHKGDRQLRVAPALAHELQELRRVSRIVRLGSFRGRIFSWVFCNRHVSSTVLCSSLTRPGIWEDVIVCGILAFFSSHGMVSGFQPRLADALELLHHRGPDDTGLQVVDDDAIFAHKRLAIIDVELSKEPLPYLDRYLLTFNGEIYNYLELREELIREHGAQFATNGDGEVVVAGFHYWGEDVLDRLRGMFAFVIW